MERGYIFYLGKWIQTMWYRLNVSYPFWWWLEQVANFENWERFMIMKHSTSDIISGAMIEQENAISFFKQNIDSPNLKNCNKHIYIQRQAKHKGVYYGNVLSCCLTEGTKISLFGNVIVHFVCLSLSHRTIWSIYDKLWRLRGKWTIVELVAHLAHVDERLM